MQPELLVAHAYTRYLADLFGGRQMFSLYVNQVPLSLNAEDLFKKMILKHNLFIHYLKIKVKFLGLDIEIKSKEKSAPSCKE